MTYEQLLTMVSFRDRKGRPFYLSNLKKEKAMNDPNKQVWGYEGRAIEELLPLKILIGGEEQHTILEVNDETVEKLKTLEQTVKGYLKNNLVGNVAEDMKMLKDDLEITAFVLFDTEEEEEDIDGYYS